MSAVTETIAAVAAAQAALAPAHEGLRDLARLNLASGSVADVKAATASYDKRAKLLEAARVALEAADAALAALAADGHPAPPAPRVVVDAVLRDLTDNRATIDAALRAAFRPEGAAGLALSGGAPTPKD